MLYQPRQHWPKTASEAAGNMITGHASSDDHEKARRFREAALPYLDDVYTLARYLLRDSMDAEDAAHECYLRALRHFDTYRGPAMKPWLFAILRNICRKNSPAGLVRRCIWTAKWNRRIAPLRSGSRSRHRLKHKSCMNAMPILFAD
jgi:hypothetical protein